MMTESQTERGGSGFGAMAAIAVLLAAGVTACSKVPLLAPSGSVINLTAASVVASAQRHAPG